MGLGNSGLGGGGGGGGASWTTTAIKTTTYTAVSDEEVPTDTVTTGAFTVNLPASPSAGNRVRILDAKSNWATANVTVGRNGSTIGGTAADDTLNIDDSWIEYTYDGTTWLRIL